MSCEINKMTDHKFKADLRRAGYSQLRVARAIGRSACYVQQRLVGYAPFTEAEEARLGELLAAVTDGGDRA